jgi:hypothetical protein
VVGLLVVASCGSDPAPTGEAPPIATSAVTATIDVVEPGSDLAQADAAVLTAAVGDEHAATVAVLLASEDGYSLEQILDAARAGRLGVDGAARDASGAPVEPAHAPSRVFVAPSGEVSATVAGLRTVSSRYPNMMTAEEAAEALYALGRPTGRAGLIILLYLLDSGYDPDQIVAALLGVPRTWDDDRLLDERGAVVPPSRPAGGRYGPSFAVVTVDEAGDPSRATDPSTAASGTPAGPAEDTTEFDELVGRAVGVYRLTADFTARLLAQPDTISVERADGELVVEPDGTVSGSLLWAYTDHIELSDGAVDLVWRAEVTLPVTALEQRDDGLAFWTEAIWEGCEGDSCMTGTMPVSGTIDVDLGQAILTSLDPTSGGDVLFART